MSSQSEVIKTAVRKVAAELMRRGLDPNDRLRITIAPGELIPGRWEAGACVIAAGLTDEDIDRLPAGGAACWPSTGLLRRGDRRGIDARRPAPPISPSS